MHENSIVYGNELELPMLVHVSRTRSHVANRVSWHSHTGYELLFLLDGATAYEFSGRNTIELHGGHFVIVPPRVVHRGLHDMRAPCTICGVALSPMRESAGIWRNTAFTRADVRRLGIALEKAVGTEHPFSPGLRWLVRRVMEETNNYRQRQDPTEAAITLRALVSAVLVEAMHQMLAPPTRPREFVSAAIEYLREHLQEPVQMPDLVRHVGYSRARFFDIFKAQTGLTPNDYLQRLRIEKAQEQLRETDLSITRIALANGFSSGQYFSTVFGRYTGVSPSQFRKGAGGKKLKVGA